MTQNQSAAMPDFKLEVLIIPVSDVDRAKSFYVGLGWRLDADFSVGPTFRVIQVTPPGSPASVLFGRGMTAAAPGSAPGMYLVVSDIEPARAALIARGAKVSEAFHFNESRERVPGPDPKGRSYSTFASFSDPDGNAWTLQEIKTRLPGRV